MRNRIAIIFFLFLCSTQVLINAQEIIKFDREKWNELKRDLNYGENNKPAEWSDDFESEGHTSGSNKMNDENKKKQSNQKGFGKYSKEKFYDEESLKSSPEEPDENENSENYTRSKIPAWLSNVLLVVLGILLTGVLIWVLLSNKTPKNKKIKINIEPEDAEDAIEKSKSELETMLKNVLEKKDYRLAVRIYFVFVIKTLKENNLIRWEKKKTNTAYLKEMQNHPQYLSFYNSVSIFEMVWYGKRALKEDEFNKIEPLFKNIIQKTGAR